MGINVTYLYKQQSQNLKTSCAKTATKAWKRDVQVNSTGLTQSIRLYETIQCAQFEFSMNFFCNNFILLHVMW